MVWYSHLFQNFLQFVVIHTIKGFSVVNETELIFFFRIIFFYDAMDLGNLISGSSAFSKTSLDIWKFTVHVLLKPGFSMSEVRGGGREELPHIQRAAAVRVQEG